MTNKNSLVDKLIEIINKSQWPAAHRNNSQARRIYERGLDEVNSYRGHPDTLMRALEIFSRTQSSAFAYAGIAFTLVTAATDQDSFYQPGFDEAMRWLEKAQEWEANLIEINFIEAVIYLNSTQLENGRFILDYLGRQNPNNYYLCLTEMNYYAQKKLKKKYIHWLEKAIKQANSGYRQAYTLNSLAGHYLKHGDYELAIKQYYQVTKIDPNDAWAWHNMSVMFTRMKKFEDAHLCNKKALNLMDFGAARQIEAQLKEKRGSKLGKLFSRKK
ncbi:MAG: tetratricopeptide repeat protein [Chloroflexi bacterium]|nr:tetratricopeptide repeat protein [Chloroflexota bacterium]